MCEIVYILLLMYLGLQRFFAISIKLLESEKRERLSVNFYFEAALASHSEDATNQTCDSFLDNCATQRRVRLARNGSFSCLIS